MLADKLLNNLDYNTDKEVHNLELLKLRFGDLSLRTAEVMIKVESRVPRSYNWYPFSVSNLLPSMPLKGY